MFLDITESTLEEHTRVEIYASLSAAGEQKFPQAWHGLKVISAILHTSIDPYFDPFLIKPLFFVFMEAESKLLRVKMKII